MGMSFYDTFENRFPSDRREHLITNARGYIGSAFQRFQWNSLASISIYQFQDIVLLFLKNATYVLLMIDKPID